MRDFRDGIEYLIPKDYDKVSDLKKVGDTNFLYGGLNLVYGLDGSGKSWQVVRNDFQNEDVFYIDTDGSNGSLFVKHCKDNGVNYIKHDVFDHIAKYLNEEHNTKSGEYSFVTLIMELIRKIITVNRNKYADFKPVFIVDSMTSVLEGLNINNAQDISPPLYGFNRYADKDNYCLIIIDHATRIRDAVGEDDFKLEGNSGAKKRTTVTINKYVAHNYSKPELGGSFICQRARGNDGGLSLGKKIHINNSTLASAVAWFNSTDSRKHAINNKISATEFGDLTKHDNSRWIKDYRYQIFDESIVGKKTVLEMKEKFRNLFQNK